MDHVTLVDHARAAAADVLTQWAGVDIDWSDVRAELDAHWGTAAADMANLEETWTGNDEHNYRNLVAREIERMREVLRWVVTHWVVWSEGIAGLRLAPVLQ